MACPCLTSSSHFCPAGSRGCFQGPFPGPTGNPAGSHSGGQGSPALPVVLVLGAADWGSHSCSVAERCEHHDHGAYVERDDKASSSVLRREPALFQSGRREDPSASSSSGPRRHCATMPSALVSPSSGSAVRTCCSCWRCGSHLHDSAPHSQNRTRGARSPPGDCTERTVQFSL